MNAVIEQRATGFGPGVWLGELRDENDKPITEHLHGSGKTRIIAPISVATTREQVVELLEKRARQLGLMK